MNAGLGDVPKGASPSLGRRHKLQFSVCIVCFVMFTISLEGNCGVIGRAVWLAVYRQPQMVNAGRGDAPKGASPSLGRRHKLQFSVCIVSFVMFTISLEGKCGVIGRAVWLAVYRQPQMVNAGRGDAPKGASPSLGRRHKLQFSVCIVCFVMFTISLEGKCGAIRRAVWLAVYRQPQMVNAGRGDVPKGASPSLDRRHKLQFSVCIVSFVCSQSVWKEIVV